MVNCCRYLINQTAKGLVTLLLGGTIPDKATKGQRQNSSGTQASPEVIEFARKCGINVEPMRAFCARYTSTRSVT